MDGFYALILAGGGGSRLWPLSRNATPKQLLSLTESSSMFRMSVERLAPLFPPENIYVVTGATHVNALRQEAPDIPEHNFAVEPFGCDSGPATALGMTIIQQRDPNAVVAVLTADHHIEDKAGFRRILSASYTTAREQNVIVTLGIAPTYAATSFGYIKRGPQSHTQDGFDFYEAQGFTEKPNFGKATEFLQSGDYSWNAGMFIWSVQRAAYEFERQCPEIHRLMRHLAIAVDTPLFEDMLNGVWSEMTKISLDYAVMERAERMLVTPVSIGWNDVGSWAALHNLLPHDSSGNGQRGSNDHHILIDTRETLICSDRLVATIGLENIIIVDSGDALLVCHKDRSEEVKAIVNQLKTGERAQYL